MHMNMISMMTLSNNYLYSKKNNYLLKLNTDTSSVLQYKVVKYNK
jgi:hypothetical protein